MKDVTVTRILSAISAGDSGAADELLPVVYDELRKLARQKMAQETPGMTLSATSLVHEAYIRLVGPAPHSNWDSRGHFFAAAAEAMRRILVENARRKQRQKHGGQHQRIDRDIDGITSRSHSDELLAVDEALESLVCEDPLAAEVVKLRYFVGFSIEDAGNALGISRANAYRHWTFARSWLQAEMRNNESG